MNVSHIRMIKTKSGPGSKPEIIGEGRVKIAKRKASLFLRSNLLVVAIGYMPDYASLSDRRSFATT